MRGRPQSAMLLPCRRTPLLCLVTSLLITSLTSGEDTVEESDGIPLEVPKCCPLGQSLEGKQCTPSELPFEPVFWGPGPAPLSVGLIYGLKCPNGRYLLEPEIDSGDDFYLLTNGSLYLPYHQPQLLTQDEFCLEAFEAVSGVNVLPLVCFSLPPDSSWKNLSNILYPIGCLISVPFLLATLSLYLWRSELRDLNGKVLCCHVGSLALAYSSLSIVKLTGASLDQFACIAVAYTIQVSFLASFFWLNVLCYNTWRRLRVGVGVRSSSTTVASQRRRFIYYSLYGWGMPLLLFLITVTMDNSPVVPSSYLKPNFGLDACWFQEESATFPYFYGPIAVILAANIVLFVLSAVRVHKHHTALARGPMVNMRDVVTATINQRRKTIFLECLALFLVMGLNWVWEVVSWWAKGPVQLWLVTDTFNTLQGVIVFYVFIIRDARARRAASDVICCRSSRPSPQPHYTLAPR